MIDALNFGDEKVKNLIISILSKEWPLSAKKIYNKIKKEGKNVSYQAVFKSLKSLNKQNILSKLDYKYSLNKEWLKDTSNFYEEISNSYHSNEKNMVSRALTKNHVVFKFDNYYKYLSAVAIVGPALAFLTKMDKGRGYGEFSQLPWPFATGEKEERMVKKLFASTKNIYIICRNKNKTNELIYKYYKTMNKNIYVKFNKNCAQDGDIYVVGNYVFKIILEEKFSVSMNKIYGNLSNKKDIDFNSLYTNLFRTKTKIIAIGTRNSEYANTIKERINKSFNIK